MMLEKLRSIKINLLLIGISALLVFILALLVKNVPQVTKIDFQILKFIQTTLSVFPMSVPAFISFLGSYPFLYWPRITFSSIIFSHKYYFQAILLFLTVEMADMLNERVIKFLVARIRPCGPRFGYSFPSGHCNFNMCLFGIILYLTLRYVKTPLWRNIIAGYCILYLSVVGIARMWINVHFFTDVIAGYLVGFAFVNIFIILDKVLRK